MNFLAPGAFFLGLLLPVIVALYLLKLRRTEREVSSTYLWRRMVRDVEANAPWQRLRPNLLLLLQLLFLAALIFALTRPFNWSAGLSGEAAIFIIDSSASMAAGDTLPSRLEAAKSRARQLVDELPDSARVTVIEAGQEAAVRASSSRDRRQANLAIESIQQGAGGSDMRVALELASAIAARQPGTQIVVLSDGNVSLPERMGLKGNLRFLPVGTHGENQAVGLLNLDARPDGQLSAFVMVNNYAGQEARRRLVLSADGVTFSAYDLTIAAGGQQPLVVDDLPQGTQVVEARLEGSDLLTLDDAAVAVRPAARTVRAALVSQGNVFLKTALGLLPGIELTEVAPENAASLGAFDLVIFDAVAPPDPLPAGNLLFIAPTRSTPLFTVTGTLDTPTLRALDAGSFLLENVTLGSISVLDAVKMEILPWAVPVVAADAGAESAPALFHGEVDGRRVAVLAFDLRHSDLPLQPAFPLLWVNLTNWLAPGLRSDIPTQVQTGESLSFPLPEGAQNVSVTRPDGTRVQVQAEGGRAVFADTGQLGYYQIDLGNDRRAGFAANLFSEQESKLEPANSLPGMEAQGETAAAGALQGQREWWRPLAFLALGLLVGEWLVYQRAALARLRDQVKGLRLGFKTKA
jgi:hypothetical protein